ncbi:MAG: flagellar hook assembly protein FlgD [Paraglaciecola sp.]|uniref:flagellar hook assembly protein FlgD n=1 Tax=Alteromonadaceae TaxID=72275 RepID=UPI00273E8F3B|nr:MULTISPECIES: flagellar hook assembly protein FlgD [Alteromonadaceae]MDP4944210.1 flagellar hook assembly protein FlgD [Alishewanella sp.]MDP5207834.1 flagellar hook assembly protein FlgD [Alishewanella sp. SMS9]MDP5028858.1 flagellar hook assembly protein FlgD [Paraglaciecola sp.]MDP5036754.1 flagellar hook assembly protein FlgD [Alishewanella sp.]MDP5129729.1 flagellar hook assembly protein FlgD [Paraglaciecola sp.]
MTTINTNSALEGMYWDTEKKVADKNNGALTQSDFFALLTQQLAYQDPTKPVENDQMIAQMTNFTMADGITKLNDNFSSLAQSMSSNQALQASSLVGRSVLTQSEQLVFTGESLSRGQINLEQPADNMKVIITKPNGELVSTFNVDQPQLGKNEFAWDGTNQAGETVAAGLYNISVEVSARGKTENAPVQVYTPVSSVSMGNNGNGITLNLLGIGAVKLADVLEVSYG